MADKVQILLVEDDVAHTELIRRAFESRSGRIDLTVVHNLREAQKHIAASTPDLVIVDFLLPDGTGIEFLSKNKSQFSFPIVLMTSHGDEQVAVDAMKAGALDYVVKSADSLMDMPRIAERALREWRHMVERQQFEKALKESEQRFRSVIEQSTDGIFLTDEQGLIIEWNHGAERITGLTRLAVLGRPSWDVQQQLAAPSEKDAPIEFDIFKQELIDFYATGEAPWLNKVVDAYYYHVNGHRSIVETLSFPIKTEKGYMAGSILRDVTASRQAEEQLQQQQRLAAVGQLAAGIAHDFNNIMAVIVLYAQISLQTPGLPLRVQERLDTMVKQAKRAAELIDQILDFSRRTVLERRPLNLITFLKEHVKLLQRTLPESITVTLSHDDQNCVINGDLTRIQHTVMNLALNARDAMPGGGRLDITIKRQHFDTHEVPIPPMEAGDYVCLMVTDSGTGIADEIKPHLFEPFFTTKRPGEGTGLGLAQVYGIVKQHEGQIDVQTKLGEGTTFSIYFPALYEQQDDVVSEGSTDLLLGRGEMILLVEDDPSVREVMSDSLKMLNYQVVDVPNGRQALNVLDQNNFKPALIISDVVMPEMGGIELFHALQRRQLSCPVILVSGHPLDQEIVPLKALGRVDSLAKPPDLSQLAQMVHQMIQ
ncbi:MAG: response regulator [Ardenticatenaceae bacterium]|nr:response regulator [Ardenticatenaceae bacterium]